MKNVVLCCDGTANEFAVDRTNVVKLFYALEHGTPAQVAYYHPGLGTMEPPGALTGFAKRITKLLGMAFGYGLEADVQDAYVFLMNSYELGDRLFLFGFSRGAYTVRVLASLLHMYGLLPKGNEPLVPYAIRMMTAANEGQRFPLAEQFQQTFSKSCKPWFVGVWDTVSSVGWVSHPLHVPYSSDNPDIEIGRQAISIDEHRAFFRQNLWRPKSDANGSSSGWSGPKNLKQVWFAGVHCDVGGGYPEAKSGLSKIALEWMLGEAHAHGLLLNKQRTDLVLGKAGEGYVCPDATAEAHESLKGLWRLAEFIPKKHFDWQTKTYSYRMNLFHRRQMPAESLVHESVLQRGEAYRQRLPQDAVPVASMPLP